MQNTVFCFTCLFTSDSESNLNIVQNIFIAV